MNDDVIDWSLTTFDGVRRAQLRAALKLSVRERLQRLDELCRLAEALRTMPRRPAP